MRPYWSIHMTHGRHLPGLGFILAALIATSVTSMASGQGADVAQQPKQAPETVLGFEQESVGAAGDRFIVPTPGWSASLVADGAAEGDRFARLVRDAGSPSKFGNLMAMLDAAPYRGKRIRLTSKMRLNAAEDGARGQMWCRVDRPDRQMGDFDNMQDRPVTARRWTRAVIELDVDADAEKLAIGWMAIGGATPLDVDDAVLRVIGDATPVRPAQPPRELTARGLDNLRAAVTLLNLIRFFHPSDQAVGVARWDLFAIEMLEHAERATDAEELARRLTESITPIAPTVQVWAGGVDRAPPPQERPDTATGARMWRHVGVQLSRSGGDPNMYRSTVSKEALQEPNDETRGASWFERDLGGGVACRIPICVPADDRGTLPHGATPASLDRSAPKPKLTLLDRSTRFADVAVAWGVFQHFYPYFDDEEAIDARAVDVTDWDGALDSALRKAAVDADARAARDTLRRLVASLHDGHGGVISREVVESRLVLPLTLRWCGDELVVADTRPPAPDTIRRGDVIVAIDGRTSEEILRDLAPTISSATPGLLRVRAAYEVVRGSAKAESMRLRIRSAFADSAESEVDVPLAPLDAAAASMMLERRPPDGSEVAPGIVYFDLCGADDEALRAVMPRLIEAKGIVFDLRGYPDSAARALLPLLIDEPVQSARWNIPIVTRPDRHDWEWSTTGRWDVEPATPRLKAPVAFLTDARAISYAESILGIVEAYRLGEIVGETTAGTNGNVNPIVLPSGTSVSWTGMKVLKHDGSRHHGVGIVPTIPVTPTPAGIAAGRDEVLERAIEHLRSTPTGP